MKKRRFSNSVRRLLSLISYVGDPRTERLRLQGDLDERILLEREEQMLSELRLLLWLLGELGMGDGPRASQQVRDR